MVVKKGYNPWNKELTKETDKRLKKVSENLKGRNDYSWNKNLTKETDERVANNGKKIKMSYTEERRKEQSKKYLGKNNPMYGKKRPDMVNNKLRKGKPSWNNGLTKETDIRLKNLAKKVSIKARQNWSDPAFAKRMFKAIACNTPSNLEKKLMKFFDKYKFDFWYCGNGKFFIERKCPDFKHDIIGNKLIEVGNIECYKAFKVASTEEEYEYNRKSHFKKHGFDCLVIWERYLDDEISLYKKVFDYIRKGIIFVVCHGDDEIIGMYKVIKKYGVEHIIYTDSQSHERQDEIKKFAKDIKFTPIFVNDIFKLKNIITKLNPNIIFTHSNSDNHNAHKKTSEIVKEIATSINCKLGLFSIDMNTEWTHELSETEQEEKKRWLNKYYPTQKSLWERDYKYFLFEGHVIRV